MVACAVLYGSSALWTLRFAGGGISQVVEDSRMEFDALVLETAAPAYVG
jgi:hypothetical protein